MDQTVDRMRFLIAMFLIGCLSAAAGTIKGSIVVAIAGFVIMIAVIAAMYRFWPVAGPEVKTPPCEKCGRQMYSPRPDLWRCSNYDCSQYGKDVDDRGLRG